MRDPIIIGLATIDGRQNSLRETLQSLVTQADEIHVYCNDYEPQELVAGVRYHVAPIGDIGDAGMMYPFAALGKSGYCLTVGDDLIFPKGYVKHMISRLEEYKREAVVSPGGRVQYAPQESYYRPKEATYCRVLDAVERDTKVTVINTAGMCWHSSMIEMSMDDFRVPNMADILFSKLCNEQGVVRIAVKHAAGWIGYSDKFDRSKTIFKRYRDNDSKQTEVFNSVEWVL